MYRMGALHGRSEQIGAPVGTAMLKYMAVRVEVNITPYGVGTAEIYKHTVVYAGGGIIPTALHKAAGNLNGCRKCF